MIACVALGVVAAHEPTRDDTMEYFGLGEAEPPYDCTGATVAPSETWLQLGCLRRGQHKYVRARRK